jgi:hypothetical protein
VQQQALSEALCTRLLGFERVDFVDGTSWTNTAINAKINVINGTARNRLY